jgi:hypothetical protein
VEEESVVLSSIHYLLLLTLPSLLPPVLLSEESFVISEEIIMATTPSSSFPSYYNLEDEENYIASYLERNTAINVTEDIAADVFVGKQIYDDGCNGGECDDDVDDEVNTSSSSSYQDDINNNISNRVYCCNTSRSLYCPECYRCLVPKKFRPRRFIQQQLRQQQQQNDDTSKHNNNNNNNNIFDCSSSSSSSFPFKSMDIILGVKERRTSSTGIQIMSICQMIEEASSDNNNNNNIAMAASSSSSSSSSSRNHDSRKAKQPQCSGIGGKEKSYDSNNDADVDVENDDTCNDNKNNSNSNKWWKNVNLYDLNREDTILPRHNKETTFVLFPQEGKSVPIYTVADKIEKLIILDIKWTRSANALLFSNSNNNNNNNNKPPGDDGHKTTSRNNNDDENNPLLSSLGELQFVHLEFPPHKSHFWRWHNRGDGMLSTIEAVYFAAREVSIALQIQERQIQDIIINKTNNENDSDKDNNDSKRNKNQRSRHHREDLDGNNDDECVDHHEQRCGYVNILWLFALQRSIIAERSIQEGRPVAFSEEAKSIARALRKKVSM